MSSDPINKLSDKTAKPYETYKKMFLFFALVDQLHTVVFAAVPTSSESSSSAEGAVGGAGAAAGTSGQNTWSGQLATWIRNNDDALLKNTAKVLSVFQVN